MEASEILREAVSKAGVKSVAADMNLSASLLYKWCDGGQQATSTGSNPLERVADLYELTGDVAIVSWLCQKAGGFFARNPITTANQDEPAMKAIREILKEFSDVLDTASQSFENDGQIDPSEAKTIRKEWEELKEVTESFVVACEDGIYMEKTGEKA
jgi:transposase-like protein